VDPGAGPETCSRRRHGSLLAGQCLEWFSRRGLRRRGGRVQDGRRLQEGEVVRDQPLRQGRRARRTAERERPETRTQHAWTWQGTGKSDLPRQRAVLAERGCEARTVTD